MRPSGRGRQAQGFVVKEAAHHLAEFAERLAFAERIHAGLARARVQGTKTGNPIGRPEKFALVRKRVLALKEEGSRCHSPNKDLLLGV